MIVGFENHADRKMRQGVSLRVGDPEPTRDGETFLLHSVRLVNDSVTHHHDIEALSGTP